jgi:radical SAM protein with 4Fe4S-binding SPASM domain
VVNLYEANYGKIWTNIYKLKKSLSFLEAPTYVQLVITHKCNYCCEHCGTSAGQPLPNELSTQELMSLISEMGNMGVKYLSVTGGEPLLRKDLFQILHHAKQVGMKVGFVTHGGLVSEFKEKISQLKPYSMMVSIDGLKETHNKLRGDNANFDKSLNAMKFFAEIKVPRRSISTTVNKRNFEDLEELKKIIFSSGANHWRINIAIPEGRAKSKEWMHLSESQILKLFQFIKENKKKFKIEICEGAGYLGEWDSRLRDTPFYCGCGWNTCTIMADGTVMGCPVFEDKEMHSEGNIRDSSFKQIWENKFERFRKLKLPDDCNSCKHLNSCRGGCWMMRIFDAHCLKEVWENNKPN